MEALAIAASKRVNERCRRRALLDFLISTLNACRVKGSASVRRKSTKDRIKLLSTASRSGHFGSVDSWLAAAMMADWATSANDCTFVLASKRLRTSQYESQSRICHFFPCGIVFFSRSPSS